MDIIGCYWILMYIIGYYWIIYVFIYNYLLYSYMMLYVLGVLYRIIHESYCHLRVPFGSNQANVFRTAEKT